MARLPPLEVNYPMKEVAARLHIYLLGLAGRADEAIPIAEAVLRHSSQAHLRSVAPFVRWSAGDASEIDSFRTAVAPAPDANARDRFFSAAFRTHIHASLGDDSRLRALADELDSMPLNRADIRDASMLAAAEVVRLVAWHDEAGARKLLAEHLDRHPISDPRCEIHLRRSLAAVYVCAPAVRPVWDCARLGRCHRRMREVAEALLQARQTGAAGPLPPEEIDPRISRALDDVDALITILPLPFAVELAARAHGLGLPAGARALEWLRHRVGDDAIAELRWQYAHGDEVVRDAVGDLLHVCRDHEAPRIAIEVLGPTRVFVEGQAVDNASARRAASGSSWLCSPSSPA